MRTQTFPWCYLKLLNLSWAPINQDGVKIAWIREGVLFSWLFSPGKCSLNIQLFHMHVSTLHYLWLLKAWYCIIWWLIKVTVQVDDSVAIISLVYKQFQSRIEVIDMKLQFINQILFMFFFLFSLKFLSCSNGLAPSYVEVRGSDKFRNSL